MSEEQLKAFIEKVQGDDNLREKLKAASDADGVVAIAKEAGFKISAEDLKISQSKLSDEEPESVAGGTSVQFTVCWSAEGGCYRTDNKVATMCCGKGT